MLYLDYSRKAGRVDSQPVRRARKPGGDRVPEKIQPPHAHGISRRDDHCRGIHRLAAGDAPAVSRRAGLLVQMEHGLDARHARLFQPRPGSSQISSERPHVRDALSSSREFHPAAVARRGGARQRLAASAGCRATTGRNSRTCARCSAINGCFPARSCCSWAANSASAPNGTQTASSTGGCSTPGRIHRGLQQFVEDLNKLYLAAPGLWQADYDHGGFYWIDCADRENSVLPSSARPPTAPIQLAVILNLTPVPRAKYRIGLPRAGQWREVLNSDAGDLRRQQSGQSRRRHGRKHCRATTSRARPNSACRR